MLPSMAHGGRSKFWDQGQTSAQSATTGLLHTIMCVGGIAVLAAHAQELTWWMQPCNN